MHEAKLHLSSAVKPPGAAAVLFLFVPDHGRTADGTGFGHLEAPGVFGTALGDRAHDFGNHVPGAAHDDGVADRKVQGRDVVFVVKGRVRDRDAPDEDGRKTRDGREFSRAPHLNVDRLEDREGLFGRVLVGAGPAGLAREKAEFALERKVVHLVDDAVDFEGKRGALGQSRLVKGGERFGTLHDAAEFRDGKTHFLEALEHRRLRGRKVRVAHFTETVCVEVQHAFGRHARIELTKRTGRGVSRIDEGLFFARFA